MSAAVAAAAAGLLALAAPIITAIAFADRPVASWLPALDRVSQSGSVKGAPSLHIASYEFFNAHSSSILASSILRFAGFAALIWALVFLAKAVKARKPEFPMQWLWVAVAGIVLEAFAVLAYGIGSVNVIRDFLAGSSTVEAAADVSSNPFLLASGTVAQLANLPIAAGFIFIALNAMRTGLLTRFMGVLGIIVGVLFFIPIGTPLPIVQVFWLGGLTLLFAGYWPTGVPPAWRTGNAEPWPSKQSLRDAPQVPEPGTGEAAATASSQAHLPGGSTKRRKRFQRSEDELEEPFR